MNHEPPVVADLPQRSWMETMMTDHGSKYQNFGQVGAMGDNAQVVGLNQTQGEAKAFDFSLFLKEAQELRQGIEEDTQATREEKDDAIAALQAAKAAAKENNKTGVVDSFKKSGKWLLGVAEKLSVQLIASILKDHIVNP